MRPRIIAWIVLAMAFLIAAYFNAIGALLQPANTYSGETIFYWNAFAFVYVVVSLATALQPRMAIFALALTTVVAIALLNRTLFFFWLGQRVVLSGQILNLFLGGAALYFTVACQVVSWGFRVTHVTYASVCLSAGLAPIAYAFAQEVRIVP